MKTNRLRANLPETDAVRFTSMHRRHYLQTNLFTLALILAGLFSNHPLPAQQLPRKALQVTGGYSLHGSGDMNGIVFGTEYIRYITPKLFLNHNLRATINHDKQTIIVDYPVTGAHTDASVRFTTAGVQLGTDLGWCMVRTRRHEASLSLGAFGRYQSASNGDDGYAIYYPQITGQPTVLIGYDNRTPQETFNAGVILRFHYNFTLNNQIYIGLSPAFQTDTNGDAIPQAALTIGKRW